MQHEEHTIKNLMTAARDHGDHLFSAGRALEAITNLIGLDGSVHHIGERDMSGLLHAVSVIGAYVDGAAFKLSEAAELAGALEVSK